MIPHSSSHDLGYVPFSRREALKLLAANVALLTSGCSKPAEQILPYVHMPERLVPGIPLSFASTLPLGGYGRGVLCTSVEGRPIKVSGNPRHPASLGSTDVFAEAHVLALYDPDRSQTIRKQGEIAASVDLETALAAQVEKAKTRQGSGLRLLTGPISSPTIRRQIGLLRDKFPNFAWHVHDPLIDLAARAGADLAFGRAVRSLPRLGEADVVVALDADPLGPGPWQIVNARGFADRRRVSKAAGGMSRVYAIESAPTLIGAKADHRLTATPREIAAATILIARSLGADLPDPQLEPRLAQQVGVIAADVAASKGRAILMVGPTQAPEIHSLVHWINQRTGAPQSFLDPDEGDAKSLDDLLQDLDAGHVDTLLISDTNPSYDSALDQHFDERLGKAGFTLHHGLYRDETSALCTWHVPAPHPLETWGDLRSCDGTPSLAQPLIEPLYATRSLSWLLQFIAQQQVAEDYDLVRSTWQAKVKADGFEDWWKQALLDGVIKGETPNAIDPGEPRLVHPQLPPDSPFAIVLRTDPTTYDGTFAGNAWLQECPKPLTKQVWGNALELAADDAARIGLAHSDTAGLSVAGREILVPVIVRKGHAPGIASVNLGNGRTNAGAIGSHVGANAYRLRSKAGGWLLQNVTIRKAKGEALYTIQKDFEIDGEKNEILPSYDLDSLPARPTGKMQESLLADQDRSKVFARWAMVIDTTSCIGCNACILACQVENNVPVVGPEEIAHNREMHWLRIDTYHLDDAGRVGFEPVPCMHCETAPCEPVCPVGASIHDSEGLNVQVYNRCIGTRFCQANCPYKVRRFNFFGYADGQAYADLGAPVMAAHNNPNVTVRARGVMEKCTYCVQRISQTRRTAEREDRSLRDGEVTTACQDACPTRAISFGDLQQPDSQVVTLREDPRHFTLLGSLNTRPRTTYLADVRNPNAQLQETRG